MEFPKFKKLFSKKMDNTQQEAQTQKELLPPTVDSDEELERIIIKRKELKALSVPLKQQEKQLRVQKFERLVKRINDSREYRGNTWELSKEETKKKADLLRKTFPQIYSVKRIPKRKKANAGCFNHCVVHCGTLEDASAFNRLYSNSKWETKIKVKPSSEVFDESMLDLGKPVEGFSLDN